MISVSSGARRSLLGWYHIYDMILAAAKAHTPPRVLGWPRAAIIATVWARWCFSMPFLGKALPSCGTARISDYANAPTGHDAAKAGMENQSAEKPPPEYTELRRQIAPINEKSFRSHWNGWQSRQIASLWQVSLIKS